MTSSSSPQYISSWPKVTSRYLLWALLYFVARIRSGMQFLNHHSNSPIPGNSCLCRSHCREAKQHRVDPKYIPIWKEKENQLHVSKCMYAECVVASADQRIITPEECQASLRDLLNIPAGNVKLCESISVYYIESCIQ